MEKIEKIIIACYKDDFYLTRICVASIRYFYPEIEIFLLMDLKAGSFSTKELEKNWNVKLLELERKKFGWGLSKLEPCFFKTKEKVLIIDSDIVFIGNVLDQLETSTADVIVSGDIAEDLNQKWVKEIYYDYEKVLNYDPNFKYPGFLFNTGNFVIKTGLLNRTEFQDLVEWNELPKLLHPEIFSCADQGILNYVIAKKSHNKNLTLQNINFMLWGKDHVIDNLEIDKIITKSNTYPYLIHWAGTRHFLIKKMCRNDILYYFEKYYYSKVKFGTVKQKARNLNRNLYWSLLDILKKSKKAIKKSNRIIIPKSKINDTKKIRLENGTDF